MNRACAVMAGVDYPVAPVLGGWLAALGLGDSFDIAADLVLLPPTYAVVDALGQWIAHKKIGVKKAFRINGVLMLYSGPHHLLAEKLANGMGRNHSRASQMACSGRYTLLDHTLMGRKLAHYKGFKYGIFDYMETLYPQDATPEGPTRAQQQAEIVMGFASAALVLCASGSVETMVCGAARDKVFALFELPALMANHKITRINGIDAAALRKIYGTGTPAQALQVFDKIGEAEVALLRRRAERCPSLRKVRLWRRYEEQNRLWQAARVLPPTKPEGGIYCFDAAKKRI